MKRILITGGHATTNVLSMIHVLTKGKRKGIWKISWVGGLSVDRRLVDKLDVSYYPLSAGRLQARWMKGAVRSFVKIPIGFMQAFYYLLRIRPHVILSFGGFAGLPIVVLGWILGIPIIIHEQTVVAGLANKLSGPFATKIALARIHSAKYFPNEKSVLVGNPLLPGMDKVKKKVVLPDVPTIYITCGSSGSQIINRVVEEVIEELLEGYRVIHQTGEVDFAMFKKRRVKMNKVAKSRYEIHDYISPLRVSKTFEKADMVISRAGANTVSDILVTRRPAILIPIPWSRGDEQSKNAILITSLGLGLLLPQEDLNGKTLLGKVYELRTNWKKMVRSESSAISELDIGASKKLALQVEELVE